MRMRTCKGGERAKTAKFNFRRDNNFNGRRARTVTLQRGKPPARSTHHLRGNTTKNSRPVPKQIGDKGKRGRLVEHEDVQGRGRLVVVGHLPLLLVVEERHVQQALQRRKHVRLFWCRRNRDLRRGVHGLAQHRAAVHVHPEPGVAMHNCRTCKTTRTSDDRHTHTSPRHTSCTAHALSLIDVRCERLVRWRADTCSCHEALTAD